MCTDKMYNTLSTGSIECTECVCTNIALSVGSISFCTVENNYACITALIIAQISYSILKGQRAQKID